MSRFVFFSAADGRVEVSIDQQPVGSAATAEELCAILMANEVSITADRCCGSSSIDFCEEEGFEPGAAGDMIDDAFRAFSG